MTLIPDLQGRRILLIAIIAILGWQITNAQSYCRPSLGSCCEWISNVSIGTINHNSINEPGYADYTSVSGTITKGTTYPISVKVSTNSIYVEHVKVFFDWDRDFIFESYVYLGSAKFTGNKILTGNVTVPSNALDGCSMMRVFMQYAKEPAGACTSSGDGEVEDYTLVVSSSSVPVANFSVPNSLCSHQNISFTNASAISDGAPLNYLWNFDDGTSSTLPNPTKTFSQPGTYLVKLTASTFCTTNSITKTIIVNEPPVISDQPVNNSVCVGGAATFSATSSVPDATYQWQVDKGTGFTDIVSNSFYTNITTSTLHISGIVADMHGYQYRCIVTKNCPIASSAATLIISSPPIITAHPADVSVCKDGSTSLSVTAAGTGLSYQWQIDSGEGFKDLSNDLVYNNVTTRSLTITGISNSFEAYKYRCVVNGMCTSNSLTAQIKINSAPSISIQPTDVKLLAGNIATFSVAASGEELTYQWQTNTGDGFVNIMENGRYRNVKSSTLIIEDALLSEDNSLYRCVLSGACDPAITSGAARLIVNNPRPVISSIPVTSIMEDSSYTYKLVVSDFTNNALAFSARSKPDWLTFNVHSQLLIGIPSNNDVGPHEITLSVSNGLFATEQTFTIRVENTNDNPVITSTPSTHATEDSIYEYLVAGYDIDKDDVLHFSILTKPDWLTFDPSTKMLKGIPSNDQVGVHDVKIGVSDGIVSVEQNFKVTVVNSNDLPVIISQAITTIHENDNYQYTLRAEDQDGDQLTYKAETIPSWLSFDEITGKLAGENASPGIHSVVLKVSDGISEVSQTFNISVIQNTVPVDTSSIPVQSDPVDITLSNKSFESTTTLNQIIGIFTTKDEDHSDHIYHLVNGQGSESNNLFNIVNNNLYLKNRISHAYSNEFSIRVRSTNSFGNFIEEIFVLEKYDPERNASAIEIPTTFSPNADGINDTWIIKDLEDYADVSIEVFDRSGVPLYKSTNPTEGWDGGVSRGKAMEGPFFYIVRIQDIVKKGVLIVIK
jgi:gliding motility-associated-like protein